jgi:hypothetical protein
VHALPHAPQFAVSVATTVHMFPHLVYPELQEKPHVEVMQLAVPFGGARQTLPQAPQSCVLFVVSTQLPPQFVWPVGHETMHVPPEQTWFAPHAIPQPPQLFTSLCSFTHAAPQALKPALHVMPH